MDTPVIAGSDAGAAPRPTAPETALFRDNALLAGISSEAFERIRQEIDVVRCEPRDVIFDEDEPGDSLYLIAEGSVKISKKGRGGAQETLTYLMERDFFGEMALVDSSSRSAQASAVGAAVLGRINPAAWALLLRLAPQEVLSNFTRSITGRLRHNNEHFIEEMMRNERLSLLGSTVSSIVHDMNNPISCILGACELMQMKIQNELTDRMTRMIRDAVERMEAMTGELIDFSRGNTQLNARTIAVAELLRGLDGEIEQIRRANIQVDVEMVYEGAVYVDRHRMLRVLGNLMRNARDALRKPEGRRITLRVERAGEQAVFEVGDNGCGIPADLLPRIFDPFVTHGKANGTGLGLAITKAVVTAHHGTISVRSVDGEGTTFQISLPTAQA